MNKIKQTLEEWKSSSCCIKSHLAEALLPYANENIDRLAGAIDKAEAAIDEITRLLFKEMKYHH